MLVNQLNETIRISRIVQHIQKPDGKFTVITGFRKGLSDRDNMKRNSVIERYLRTLTSKGGKTGFIRLQGTYDEDEVDEKGLQTGHKVRVREHSFFINNLSFKSAVKLARRFDQDSFIYKDKNEFALFDKNGKKIVVFDKAAKGIGLSLSPSDFKFGYSELVKGAHSDKRFTFLGLEEQVIIGNSMAALIGRGLWKKVLPPFF